MCKPCAFVRNTTHARAHARTPLSEHARASDGACDTARVAFNRVPPNFAPGPCPNSYVLLKNPASQGVDYTIEYHLDADLTAEAAAMIDADNRCSDRA